MVTVLASDKSQSERVDTSVPVEVSVVIPCLNEANSLAFCIDKAVTAFRGAGLSGEVIVPHNDFAGQACAAERGHRFIYAKRQRVRFIEVSVVIPCLNEANSLAFCIDKAVTAFRGAGLSGEVIVGTMVRPTGRFRLPK